MIMGPTKGNLCFLGCFASSGLLVPFLNLTFENGAGHHNLAHPIGDRI